MKTLLGSVAHEIDSIIYQNVSLSLGEDRFINRKPGGILSSNYPILERGDYCITGIIDWFTTDFTVGASKKENSEFLDTFLNCWIHERTSLLKKIDGEFAVIIWAFKSQEIWLIRDIFGTQPLHYFRDDRDLAFATNARPLWTIPPTPPKINEDRILDFIVDDLEHVDQVSTFKKGIFKIPSGSIAHWKRGKQIIEQYWNPIIDSCNTEISENQVLGKFQHYLSESLSKRLATDKPCGLTLSGGLDSNTIMACWYSSQSQERHENLHLFSLIPETNNRQDPESQMLLNLDGIPAKAPRHWITPSEALNLVGPAEDFMHALEDPFAIHSLSGPTPCYKKAAKMGINWVMDGIDGDMVAGIPSKYWRFLWREKNYFSAISECLMHHHYEEESIIAAFLESSRMILSGLLPYLYSQEKNINKSELSIRHEADQLIDELSLCTDKFNANRVIHRIKCLKQNHHPTKPKSIEESITNGLKSPMLGVAVDRYHMAGRACGLNATHPLLDRKFIEFLLSLNWNNRAYKGEPKYLFRQYLRKKGLKRIAEQPELGHVGPWFTKAFLDDYKKRYPHPKPEALDALSPFVKISSYQNAYNKIVKDKEADDTESYVWSLTMMAEWLLKNT